MSWLLGDRRKGWAPADAEGEPRCGGGGRVCVEVCIQPEEKACSLLLPPQLIAGTCSTGPCNKWDMSLKVLIMHRREHLSSGPRDLPASLPTLDKQACALMGLCHSASLSPLPKKLGFSCILLAVRTCGASPCLKCFANGEGSSFLVWLAGRCQGSTFKLKQLPRGHLHGHLRGCLCLVVTPLT